MGLADFRNSIITKDGFSQTFNKFDRSVQSSARGLDKFGGALSGNWGSIVGGLAGAAGAVAIGKMALELGNLGAQSLVTKDSFESVTTSVGKTTALLGQMKAAAGGTIDEMRLMQFANTALAGASGETGAAFADVIPKLIEGARAANKLNPALGDTEFLFKSLVTGIKRSSALLIDNTGITLSEAEANKKFADSVGKTVAALTADEKQLALIYEVTRGVDRIVAQAGGNLDTMATSADKLKVAFQELKIAVGEALAPVTSGAQETLASWLTLGKDALSSDAISRTKGELDGLRIVLETLNNTPVDPGSVLSGGAAFFSDADKQNAIQQAMESIQRLEAELSKLTADHNKAAYAANTGETAFSAFASAAISAGDATQKFGTKASRLSAFLAGVVTMLDDTADAAIRASNAMAASAVDRISSGMLGATDVVSESDYINRLGAASTAVNVLTAALNNGLISQRQYDYQIASLTQSNNEWVAGLQDAARALTNVGNTADSIKSKIGSALRPTFDLAGLTGGLLGGGGGDTFDEAYKRLAAVALRPEELQIHAGDWGDTFAKAGLTGLSPEDAQKRARELVEAYSKGLDFSLIDREKIKDSVRQAIKAEELYNSIVDEIYAEMGKEKPKLEQAGRSMAKQIHRAATDEVKTGMAEYVGAWVSVLTPEVAKAIDAAKRRYGGFPT